jgi:hypothetical protein
MKKILKWIKEHVRPVCKYNRPKENKNKKDNSQIDIDDLRDNTEIGIKFKFKF